VSYARRKDGSEQQHEERRPCVRERFGYFGRRCWETFLGRPGRPTIWTTRSNYAAMLNDDRYQQLSLLIQRYFREGER